MAYETKPGSGSIFKNKRKETDNHPDYTGNGKDLNGNDVWFSLWVKKDKNGNSYFSLSMQPKKDAQQTNVTNVKDVDDLQF